MASTRGALAATADLAYCQSPVAGGIQLFDCCLVQIQFRCGDQFVHLIGGRCTRDWSGDAGLRDLPREGHAGGGDVPLHRVRREFSSRVR